MFVLSWLAVVVAARFAFLAGLADQSSDMRSLDAMLATAVEALTRCGWTILTVPLGSGGCSLGRLCYLAELCQARPYELVMAGLFCVADFALSSNGGIISQA